MGLNKKIKIRFTYSELNYHHQKIRQTFARDIRKPWKAVPTLLDLISSVYRDPHTGFSGHGNSNYNIIPI